MVVLFMFNKIDQISMKKNVLAPKSYGSRMIAFQDLCIVAPLFFPFTFSKDD
jgi:hypothetical protein